MNKLLLNIIVILCCSISFYGQNKIALRDTEELKIKLKQQAKATKTIIASFKQEKQVSFMKTPQLSSGFFYYQQTDKMRWEQKKPQEYVLLINDEKIRIKDNGKEKNTAGANKMMGKINTLMIGLINGEIFDDKAFSTKYFSIGDYYLVELTPKNKRLKSIFNTIELSFSKKTIRLKELVFNESSGDKTTMKFFNEKYNQPIESSRFTKL